MRSEADAATAAGRMDVGAEAEPADGPSAETNPTADAAAADAKSGGDSSSPPSATIPLPRKDSRGMPIDVGLLIIGHSTSQDGGYPSKLVRALNQRDGDGRNYVHLDAIVRGDGGYLWTQLSWAPDDPQYHRATVERRHCTDERGVRWSCRRARLEASLREAPRGCLSPQECGPQRVDCVWHEDGQRHQRADMPFRECWMKMDVKLALVQDTSNRSLPLLDRNRDGKLDDHDYFGPGVSANAARCADGPGLIAGNLDWNCDGRLSAEDASARVYAGWLRKLAMDLLTGFGPASADHVFITHKPVERGTGGDPYTRRTPSPDAPFPYPYAASVYWEHRAIEALFQSPDLDPRIHPASPGDPLRMWDRSAQCFERGIAPDDWTIPAAAGRPTRAIEADVRVKSGTGGCFAGDAIHQNDNGGWLLADVWYEGLTRYW